MAAFNGVREAIARRRRRPPERAIAPPARETAHEVIDVTELLDRYSVEELAEFADAYFARLADWRFHLVKPYASHDEAPRLLSVFGALLEALDLVPGMTVLDFGVGSCWTSHALAQLRCEVIACDVSAAALDIGRELFARRPLIGDTPEPKFLHFDGHALALEDASVDRVAVTDAFHHVPNHREVLEEFFRVLRPGGWAVFAEPGPHHSITPQSQTEMRNFTCIERDIVMEEIEALATAVGFCNVQVGIYSPSPFFVDVASFDATVHERPERLVAETKRFLENHRLFVLHKPGDADAADSRRRWGLRADFDVEVIDNERVVAHVKNTSDLQWLPTGTGHGEVNLGVMLRDPDGQLVDLDFQRCALRFDGPIAPGEEVDVELVLLRPEPGKYQLEFDLVSEGVTWFASNGNPTLMRPFVVKE